MPEIDNLYLDMNGIIHPCTHGNSDSVVEQAEDEMFNKICMFVDQLVQLTKPRKLLFLAIDGVAPRAKMNQQVSLTLALSKTFLSHSTLQCTQTLFHHVTEGLLFRILLFKLLSGWLHLVSNALRTRNTQRARRFRAAQQLKGQIDKASKAGERVTATPFDSNCITPGTTFMARLTKHLRYYIRSKLETDAMWRAPEIILSGHEVPGEGEHKV